MSGVVTGKRVTSYQSYFSKVLAKRLKYLNNINAILAVIVSISLRIASGKFWWNLLMTLFVRGPFIFIALLLIKLSLDHCTTVEYSPHKTIGLQIYHSLISKKFISTSIFYIVSSCIFHSIFIMQLPFKYDYYLLSKEYQQKPIINDEWVYYWFYSIYLAVIYTSHHSIFQRNRLNFQYGVTKVRPEDALLCKLPNLMGNSIFFNVVIGISGPIIYWITRSTIYKLNWPLILIMGLDTKIPSYHIRIKTLLSISYLSFHVLFCWEVVNHVYSVYSTIGCLDGNKPISTYSSDPINTLLSGLRNVEPENQLSRLTAFQELAYIATTNDPEGVKLRTAIYNAHSKGGFVWPAILDECSLVIKETTARINYRSASDLGILKQNQNQVKDEYKNALNTSSSMNEDEIFGNSFILSPVSTGKSTPTSNLRKYNTEEALKDQRSKSNFKSNQYYKVFELQILEPIKTVLAIVLDSKSQNHSGLLKIQKYIKCVKYTYKTYHDQFLSTNIGIFFRVTLKRDTESRIINPVNFGNSIIAITNLLIHSIQEDKNSTVANNHVSDVLNLLEKPIRATRNYTDYLPASVYLSPLQKRDKKLIKNHLIALLHDLTMNEFFQLCVKFNYKLNDLVLNSRTFKLAKWVIDVAIAQQQTNQKKKVKNDFNIKI